MCNGKNFLCNFSVKLFGNLLKKKNLSVKNVFSVSLIKIFFYVLYYEFFDYTLNLKQLEHFFTLEVLIISTLQQLTLEGAASTQGHAVSVGKERKMTAHSEACRSVVVIFLPLVVELSMGVWDGEAADIRAIAALWIGRLPTRSPELDGII